MPQPGSSGSGAGPAARGAAAGPPSLGLALVGVRSSGAPLAGGEERA